LKFNESIKKFSNIINGWIFIRIICFPLNP